jgi:hypothetical protein
MIPTYEKVKINGRIVVGENPWFHSNRNADLDDFLSGVIVNRIHDGKYIPAQYVQPLRFEKETA